MSFEALYSKYLPQILDLLAKVPHEVQSDTLGKMCAYHLKTGGKRLRALLPLMVAEALNQDPQKLIPFGAACEMLHNATLVHDDVQDADKIRRGQPTVWTKYGLPQALNLGDAMFYYAILLVYKLDFSPIAKESAVKHLITKTLSVIDGQEREFGLKTLKNPTLDDYYKMVEGKTSGLFALPLVGAAELCGASTYKIAALELASTHMGVLFQIQDDILDLYGDKGRDSKGNDIREGKRSILAVHALTHSKYKEEITKILNSQDNTATEIARMYELFDKLSSKDFAFEALDQRHKQALKAVEGIPDLSPLISEMCDRFLLPIKGL